MLDDKRPSDNFAKRVFFHVASRCKPCCSVFRFKVKVAKLYHDVFGSRYLSQRVTFAHVVTFSFSFMRSGHGLNQGITCSPFDLCFWVKWLTWNTSYRFSDQNKLFHEESRRSKLFFFS